MSLKPKLHQVQNCALWMMTAKSGEQCATARSTTLMLHEDICFKAENAARYYKVDAKCCTVEGLPNNVLRALLTVLSTDIWQATS